MGDGSGRETMGWRLRTSLKAGIQVGMKGLEGMLT